MYAIDTHLLRNETLRKANDTFYTHLCCQLILWDAYKDFALSIFLRLVPLSFFPS